MYEIDVHPDACVRPAYPPGRLLRSPPLPPTHFRPPLLRRDFFANLGQNVVSNFLCLSKAFPRALLESFWRASCAQEPSNALPEASGVDFWSHFGFPNGAFLACFSSFRGIVFFDCICTVFCLMFFLFQVCSRSARKCCTRRLYRKNQWFDAYF